MSPVSTVTAKTAITDYDNNMQLSPLHIQDSASNLLTYLSQLGPLISASKIASVVISGTNTVTAAQAESLSGLPSLSLATGATLVVSDSAANLLLTGNTAGLSIATSIKISGDNTVTAAQSTALATMGATLSSSAVLHVVDSATNLLAASYPSGSGTTFTLAAGSNTIDAAQMTSLVALRGFGLNPGATITVIDNATNLLANSSAINKYAASVELSGANVINSAQAVTLVKLKGFMLDGGTITVEDTAANILSGRSTWASKVAGVEISGANTVTASQATTIAGLGSFSLADGATFVVSDTAANLVSSGNASGVALATSLVLTGTNSIGVAQATLLAGISNLTLGSGASLTISDTAANLAAYSLSFGFKTTLSISGDSIVDVAQATTLYSLGATRTQNAVVHLEDSAAALLAASPGALSIATYTLITGANTVTAAQATTLAAMTRFGGVSGSSLTVQDSAANVLANVAAVGQYASNTVLTGENTITAANLVTLFKVYDLTWNTSDPYGLVVNDTYANINSAQTTISGETIARNYGPNTSALSYIVSNAPMVAASSLQSSSQVLSFTIADIGANLGGSALVPLEWDDKLTGITVTDHGALNMSYSQFVGLTHVVSLISGQFSIDLTNVPVSAAATIQSNSLVSGFTVADSFNNISSDYMELQSYSKLSGIDPTYQAEYSQSALSFYAQFNADSLSLSDVPVAGVSGVENLASVAGFTITDTAADFAGKTSTFALLPQVTSINVTGSGGATDLNLVGVVFPATISMGSNTASVSAGLGTPTPTFTGTPDTIELGSGPSTINYALQPGSGIEVISNFAYGLDTLNINLESASSSVLETFDTTLNGKAAIEITSSADPTHGVILAGVTQNMSAANLLSSHVSFTGGYAVIT
jgi:hypothetical protein